MLNASGGYSDPHPPTFTKFRDDSNVAHVRTYPLYFFDADLNISLNNERVMWKNVRL
jgi:hypothetical protein